MLYHIKRKSITAFFCTNLLVYSCLIFGFANCANATENSIGTKEYKIINPYESVDWNSFGQFKACLHMHTNEFDGKYSPKEMIEDCYINGYDVAAITDHNITNSTWDRTDKNPDNYLTTERLKEIKAGIGRNGRGMLPIPFSTEQTVLGHVNTYWADFCESTNVSIESKIKRCEELGGISHINHPGGDESAIFFFYEDQITEAGAEYLNEYTRLFHEYPSCVGIEALNKRYGNRESFRQMWDHILMNTMPNRPVWGFSSDDSHSVDETGFNSNIMLMPENTEENIRYSMENGTFYAVTSLTNNMTFIDSNSQNSFPIINNIIVNQEENSITISAQNYETIEWIADCRVIATGNRIDLNYYEDCVNNYIRAQIKGSGGLSLTQPFGIIDKTNSLIGDIDNNGKIDVLDFARLRKHILGLSEEILTPDQMLIADVDRNGELDSIDFAFMRLYLLGVIKNF